jgi:hypothetical protein
LNGFLRMRPVFFRMLPTLESSFFSSTVALAGMGVGLGAAFLDGTAAAAGAAVVRLGDSGFGSSAGGFGSSAGGCGSGSGVGFTSGTGFDVLAALGGGGV